MPGLKPLAALTLLGLAGSLGPGTAQDTDLLNRPPQIEPASGAVVARGKKGGIRWRSGWSVDRVQRDGQPMLHFREQGSGRYSPFKTLVRWELEAFWTASPRYAPLSYQKQYFELGSGRLLVTERRTFDWTRNRVRFQRVDAQGGRSQDRTLAVPRDVLTAEGLATALRSFPFETPRRVTAHFLSDEPKVYSVGFKLAGRQTVSTDTGPIDCYKIKMDFDLGVLNLFKAFIPDTRLWFAVQPPHRWVQYRGLESGRDSPVITRTVSGAAQSGPPR